MNRWVRVDSETLVNLAMVTSIYIEPRTPNKVNFSIYHEKHETAVFEKPFSFPIQARNFLEKLTEELTTGGLFEGMEESADV